jgi:FAD/FMN-containing dehydrogenase
MYVNFMASDDDNRVKDAYRDGKYERLAAIKDKYDPDNVFRNNANVRPTQTA